MSEKICKSDSFFKLEKVYFPTVLQELQMNWVKKFQILSGFTFLTLF